MSSARGPRVLVVEDDADTRAIQHRLLTTAGYVVEVAADVQRGIATFETFDPDLVLLDLGLGGGSGLDVLRRIRETRAIPVIVVSGAERLEDRVDALERGAVDYLVKPFANAELLARVAAQLRDRGRTRTSGRQGFGDGLEIDFDRGEAFRDGSRVRLTPREFAVLAALASTPGRRHSRGDLLRDVWATTEAMQDPSTVNVHVRRLRAKLERDPLTPRWVRTAEGRGYVFEP